MAEAATIESPDTDDRAMMRERLLDEARRSAVVGHIVGALIQTGDGHCYSAQIIALTRGLIHDVAKQLLDAENDGDPIVQADQDALVAAIADLTEVVSDIHAQALEYILAIRLSKSLGVDPAYAPVMQAVLSSDEDVLASFAMKLIGVQSRFIQQFGRAHLPLDQMSGDMLHAILKAWRDHAGRGRATAIAMAESRIRNTYSESDTRAALLDRMNAELDNHQYSELSIEHLGLSLFASRLAARLSVGRPQAIQLLDRSSIMRLTLGLRAAGLPRADVQREISALHANDRSISEWLDLTPDEAIDLFRQADTELNESRRRV